MDMVDVPIQGRCYFT